MAFYPIDVLSARSAFFGIRVVVFRIHNLGLLNDFPGRRGFG
jgi:hypothetical protein